MVVFSRPGVNPTPLLKRETMWRFKSDYYYENNKRLTFFSPSLLSQLIWRTRVDNNLKLEFEQLTSIIWKATDRYAHQNLQIHVADVPEAAYSRNSGYLIMNERHSVRKHMR